MFPNTTTAPTEAYIAGLQSTVNTTTAALGGSATYTGQYEQNTQPEVCVSCISDVAGTLYFDFSPDGVNTNTFPVAGFPVAAGIHEFHAVVKAGRYFRIRYINGSGAQSYLRLYTYYGLFRQPNAPLNSTLAQDSDAIVVRTVDTILDISAGRFAGFTAVHKFGHAPSGVQTSVTDIWSRADATPTQQIWVAPTQARIHAIASSSDVDGKTGAPTSAGARTVRITGLISWAAAESSETVTLDGTTAVNTVSSYVIIHRMKVLTAGTTSINVGTITATAATDATITAVIIPGEGQTSMAIYGVPSTQKFYMTSFTASINDSTATVRVDMSLRVNESPDVSPLNVRFIDNGEYMLQNSGSSFIQKTFNPYQEFVGPCIIKMQGVASTADVDTFAGFDGYLVDN